MLHCVVIGVQRFPEKALFLLDDFLPKGTHPALISTCLVSSDHRVSNHVEMYVNHVDL